MKRLKTKEMFFKAGIIVLGLIVCAGFVLTPFDGNVKVFMGGAKQAAYLSDNILIGSYMEWELKGVFNRMWFYLLYKLASLFSVFPSYSFEVIVNAFFTFAAVISIFISIHFVFDNFAYKKKFFYTLLSCILLFSTYINCHLEPEMTCQIILLVALGLYINAINKDKTTGIQLFASGLLIGSLFYFKSILILLSVCVVAVAGIWLEHSGKKHSMKRLMTVVAGSIAMLVLNGILIYFINPSEFQSMANASIYQHTLLSSMSTKALTSAIHKFCRNYIKQSIPGMPFLLVGSAALICNFIRWIKCKELKLIFWHAICWLFPMLAIILSNKFYIYHYVSFFLPSAVEIVELGYKRTSGSKIFISSVSIVAIAVYILFISVFSDNFRYYVRTETEVFDNNLRVLETAAIDENAQMLYLDDGKGSFYIGNASYLTEYFPLSLQRLPEASANKTHKESLAEAIAYNGKYISLYDSWFFINDNNKSLKKKLEEEYMLLTTYETFSIGSDIFETPKPTEMEIWVRK